MKIQMRLTFQVTEECQVEIVHQECTSSFPELILIEQPCLLEKVSYSDSLVIKSEGMSLDVASKTRVKL